MTTPMNDLKAAIGELSDEELHDQIRLWDGMSRKQHNGEAVCAMFREIMCLMTGDQDRRRADVRELHRLHAM